MRVSIIKGMNLPKSEIKSLINLVSTTKLPKIEEPLTNALFSKQDSIYEASQQRNMLIEQSQTDDTNSNFLRQKRSSH